MFSIYLEELINHNKNEDGVIDYQRCSDFEIAKELGLTSNKVRNLKVKKQQRYPVVYDWKVSLSSMRENIRYDEHEKKIVIPIPDPNVRNEVQNFIEEKGGYIEAAWGSNAIKMRLEYLVMMFYEVLESDSDKEKFKKEIIKNLKEHEAGNSIVSFDSKAEMINHILGIIENSTGTICNLTDMFDNPLGLLLNKAIELIKK
jgi:hypothetical protein